MNDDELTDNLKDSDQQGITTQPTVTAIFRLLREVQDGQKGLNSRLDLLEKSVNSRFDAMESRLSRDFAGVDARFAEMSEEIKKSLLQLSDKLCDRIDRIRLHAEADYEDLLRRIRKLESKAS